MTWRRSRARAAAAVVAALLCGACTCEDSTVWIVGGDEYLNDTALNVSALSMCVEAYRERTGAYPRSLDDLQPADLVYDVRMVGPKSKEPIQYQLRGEDFPLIEDYVTIKARAEDNPARVCIVRLILYTTAEGSVGYRYEPKLEHYRYPRHR